MLEFDTDINPGNFAWWCNKKLKEKTEPETKRLERTKYRDCCVTCNDWNKMCDYLESKHGTLEYTEPKQ